MRMTNAPRHRLISATRFLALGTLALAAALPVGAERGPQRRVPVAAAEPAGEARVIVKFKATSGLVRALSASAGEAPAQRAQALSSRLGMVLTQGRAIGAHAQVLTARGLSSQQLAERLGAEADVEYAVVDGRKRAYGIPNDTLYRDGQPGTPATGQWYLRPPTSNTIVDATSIVSSINAQAAWDVTNGRASVVVAVLDTGVRFDHPDLATKLRPGYDFVSEPVTAADGSGRDPDASDPGDFVVAADAGVVPGCTAGDVSNSSWHGTQTAGLVGAATNNGLGMAGAGRDVMVLPVRVLGKCGGFDSDIQAAMLWAGGVSANPTVNPYPAKVINLSLGSKGACSAAYADVIGQLSRAGVSVVVAAGNDGLDVGTPANCAGAIAVAGIRHAGTKVGFSDLGPAVSIAAPAGNCVNTSGTCLFPLLTTSNSGTTTPVTGAAGGVYTSGTDASVGTSFATPLVAGTLGLMYSANATLTPALALAQIRATARPFPSSGAAPIQRNPGDPFVPVAACQAPTAAAQDYECYCTTSTCGAGMLDAAAAVAAVAQVTAQITTASTRVTPGSNVTLDGSGSNPGPGAGGIASYQWVVTSGAELITAQSSANASTFTFTAAQAGAVGVSLTVTDVAGRVASSSVALTVGAAPAPAPAPAAEGSGGGGGALPFGWLLAWALGIAGVWAAQPRRR